MKARTIQVQQHGGPEELKLFEVDVGDPGPDEVRIRQHAVGLNYIDIYHRSGLYPLPVPHGIGSEAAGVVEAAGNNVKFLKEGDRVAYPQSPPGSYCDLRVLSAAMVVRLPAKLGFEEAAAIMLKGLTVQYLFRQTYRLQGNETILFHAAAGGVGLIACQWARALGVKLIGTVSSPEKAALAKKFGAWETIDYSKENFAERVKQLTGGAKVPVVYDGVGKDTWEGSLDCLQPRGLMVSFGNASGAVTGVNLGILASKGSLFVTRPTLGTHVVPRRRLEESAAEMFDLIGRGKLKIEIDQRYPLADVARAHVELAARKTTGSSVVLP
jgi:NADPH:quinone reductase